MLVRKIFKVIDIFKIKYRVFILKMSGAKIGKDVKIYGRIKVINPENLTIGENVTFNEGVYINCKEKVFIDDNCRISAYAMLITTQLVNDLSMNKRVHISSPIAIGKNVWVCAGSIIGMGVTLSDGITVASNSFVKSTFTEENSIIGGTPAKYLKKV